MRKPQFDANKPLRQAYEVDFRNNEQDKDTLRQGFEKQISALLRRIEALEKSAGQSSPVVSRSGGSGGSIFTGTVTSVSLSVPGTLLTLNPPTITTSGSFNLGLTEQSANVFFSGPVSGADATPTWREIDVLDLPAAALNPGTVTSVSMTAPASVFTTPVSGSPITGTGTFALAFINQNANSVLAGPASGLPGVPTFRALTSADLAVIALNIRIVTSASSSGDRTTTATDDLLLFSGSLASSVTFHAANNSPSRVLMVRNNSPFDWTLNPTGTDLFYVGVSTVGTSSVTVPTGAAIPFLCVVESGQGKWFVCA